MMAWMRQAAVYRCQRAFESDRRQLDAVRR